MVTKFELAKCNGLSEIDSRKKGSHSFLLPEYCQLDQTEFLEIPATISQLGVLKFFPAGFTKPNNNNLSRQKLYQAFYLNHSYYIQLICELIPELQNPFDSNAIRIVAKIPENNNLSNQNPKHLYSEGYFDIGFIPKKINQFIDFSRIEKINFGAMHYNSRLFCPEIHLYFSMKYEPIDKDFRFLDEEDS